MTEAKIKANYLKLHNELSDGYYSGASGLTKKEFDTQHGQIWTDMESELRAGGFIAEPEPIVDWQTEYDKASSSNKVRVLARMQGLKTK